MLAAAVLSTIIGVLPMFLLGGLAVLVRADLGFGEAQLGLAVSLFFTVGALTAVLAGQVVRAVGSYPTTLAAAGLSAVSLVGMSLASTYELLLAGVVLAGFANALAQVGTNDSLARAVPKRRQGAAFGIKQGAVPAATLLVGFMLPVVALTVGWRPAVAGAALLVLVYVPLAPKPTGRSRPAMTGRRDRTGDAPVLALVVIAAAAALASAASNALGTFLIESTVSTGVAPEKAGLLLAGGSTLGIASRVYTGWRADSRDGGHLLVISTMFVAGAVGMALLATQWVAAVVPGTVLAFGLGWSWPGLLIYAVVRLNPATPAVATSINQTGVFSGGAVGPLAFGYTVQAWSYPVAWSAAAVAMLAAALLMTKGRQLLLEEPRA